MQHRETDLLKYKLTETRNDGKETTEAGRGREADLLLYIFMMMIQPIGHSNVLTEPTAFKDAVPDFEDFQDRQA
jgi:hypothetical protein